MPPKGRNPPEDSKDAAMKRMRELLDVGQIHQQRAFSAMDQQMRMDEDGDTEEFCGNCKKQVSADRKKKKSGTSGSGAGGGKNFLMFCSGCKSIKYCSAECQRSHWSTHKPSCTSLSSPPLSPTFRTTIRPSTGRPWDFVFATGVMPMEVMEPQNFNNLNFKMKNMMERELAIHLGNGKKNGGGGVGIWVATAGTEMGGRLGSPLEPVDPRMKQTGTAMHPAFNAWAGLEPSSNADKNKPSAGSSSSTNPQRKTFEGQLSSSNEPNAKLPKSFTKSYLVRERKGKGEIKKCTRSCMLAMKILVQNRRKDKLPIRVRGREITLFCNPIMKEYQLPEDLDNYMIIDNRSTKKPEAMTLQPWVDYLNQPRVAITEINGVAVPLPPKVKICWGGNSQFEEEVFQEYDDDGDGEGLKRPTGGPGGVWDKVKSWKDGMVELDHTDWVVFHAQFRLGDGDEVVHEAQVVEQIRNVCMEYYFFPPQSKTATTTIPKFPSKILPSPIKTNPYQLGGNPRGTGKSGDPLVTHIRADVDEDAVKEEYAALTDPVNGSEEKWTQQRNGNRRANATIDMLGNMFATMMTGLGTKLNDEAKRDIMKETERMGFDPDMLKEFW